MIPVVCYQASVSIVNDMMHMHGLSGTLQVRHGHHWRHMHAQISILQIVMVYNWQVIVQLDVQHHSNAVQVSDVQSGGYIPDLPYCI